MLTQRELEAAARGNPFADAAANPTSLHLFFLADPPDDPDLRSMEALKANGERYHLARRVLYLHTPGGFGKSRLAERVERLLRVEATARNWRTVTALLAMAGATRGAD